MNAKATKNISIFLFLFSILVSCGHTAKTKQDKQSDILEKDSILNVANPARKDTSIDTKDYIFKVDIKRISIEDFLAAKQKDKTSKPLKKITDFATVQKSLAGVVDFKEMEGYLGIEKIHFRNGAPSADKGLLDECTFVAYFPSEDILLLEGGHTTDVSFDLGTGQETYEAGNPNLVIRSSGGRYRLNKIYEGQECFYHFIQENKNGKFKKILELNELFEKKHNKWLCVIEKEFWTDDYTLFFGLVTEYKEDGNECEYYKMSIIESNN
jgi:hypothetical protein